VRTAKDTLWRHVTISIQGKNQDCSPVGYEDLPVHHVDVQSVRPTELGVWSLNDANRRFLAVRSAPEGEDGVGKRIRHDDFIIDRVVANVVHGPAQLRVLPENSPRRRL